MPKIDQINNIKIYINRDDHLPPHFHLYYADVDIYITIKDFKIKGHVPKSDLRKVKKWYKKINKNDLLNVFILLNPHLKI